MLAMVYFARGALGGYRGALPQVRRTIALRSEERVSSPVTGLAPAGGAR